MQKFPEYDDGAEQNRSSPLAQAIAERDRMTIEMVKHAIAKRNVMLAYQPVVTAGSTEKPAFYEGLVRILDETGRVIPAAEFIEAIEITEFGRQIDCLALQIGLQTLADVPGLRLSINMSARSIGYGPWMETLKQGLALGPTVGERLILEITESSAMAMPDQVCTFMDALQHQSVTFALDDFGSGYTSFRYLRDFYFDIIKIDGLFIRGIHANPDNQVLAKALISIAKHFEMFTVAEFVENAADAEFLTAIGVDCLQGYYFGAPTLRPNWIQSQEQRNTG